MTFPPPGDERPGKQTARAAPGDPEGGVGFFAFPGYWRTKALKSTDPASMVVA